jgi:hypothetical protein
MDWGKRERFPKAAAGCLGWNAWYDNNKIATNLTNGTNFYFENGGSSSKCPGLGGFEAGLCG